MSERLPVQTPAEDLPPPFAFVGPEPIDAGRVRAVVERDLAVASVEVPRDAQRDGALVLRGRLLRPSHEVFPRWMAELKGLDCTPVLHSGHGVDPDDVVVRIYSGVVRPGHPRVWINAVLFALTVFSTLFVGMLLFGDNSLVLETPWDLLRPGNLITGLPFAATLLSILGAHEFGHYFVARYHRVAVTLPYFIPMPIPPFGTLGAFIQLKEPVPDQRRLFDIGVAGPLAGLAVALPLLFYGLATSPMLVPTPTPGAMLEGNSLLYLAAKFLIFGKFLPNPLTGEDVMMNQVTFAAWIGLLMTALNLMPVGQLDGGHTVFAMFGKKARFANFATVALLALFAVASLGPVQRLLPGLDAVGYSGWFLWLFLILFVIGIRHPPALDDVTTLNRARFWLGVFVILIFVVTFVPVPMRPMG